jgi:hypothetical protein
MRCQYSVSHQTFPGFNELYIQEQSLRKYSAKVVFHQVTFFIRIKLNLNTCYASWISLLAMRKTMHPNKKTDKNKKSKTEASLREILSK